MYSFCFSHFKIDYLKLFLNFEIDFLVAFFLKIYFSCVHVCACLHTCGWVPMSISPFY